MNSLKQILDSADLEEEPVSEEVVKAFEERTSGMFVAAWRSVGCDVKRLDEAVRIYGLSCFLQGIYDAADTIAAHAKEPK